MIRTVPFTRIENAVCRFLDVTHEDLCSDRRAPKIVLAREAVSYIARRLTAMTYPQIASGLGRRGHTLSLYAARRMHEKIESRSEVNLGGEVIPLATFIERIESRIVPEAPAKEAC